MVGIRFIFICNVLVHTMSVICTYICTVNDKRSNNLTSVNYQGENDNKSRQVIDRDSMHRNKVLVLFKDFQLQ